MAKIFFNETFNIFIEMFCMYNVENIIAHFIMKVQIYVFNKKYEKY